MRFTVSKTTLAPVLTGLAVALAAAAVPSSAAAKQTNLAMYDGIWNFNMTSSCPNPVPSAALTIDNGVIRGPFGGGRVDPTGKATGHWSLFGLVNARLTGQLSSDTGGGSWQNDFGCHGRWTVRKASRS